MRAAAPRGRARPDTAGASRIAVSRSGSSQHPWRHDDLRTLVSVSIFVAGGARDRRPGSSAEWDTGAHERELGGQLVVDDYGVDGPRGVRGPARRRHGGRWPCASRPTSGTPSTPSTSSTPRVEPGAELDYLAWAYLRPARRPTDEQAAAVNLLAWRYTGAQRRTGVRCGRATSIEVRVLGVGRLDRRRGGRGRPPCRGDRRGGGHGRSPTRSSAPAPRRYSCRARAVRSAASRCAFTGAPAGLRRRITDAGGIATVTMRVRHVGGPRRRRGPARRSPSSRPARSGSRRRARRLVVGHAALIVPTDDHDGDHHVDDQPPRRRRPPTTTHPHDDRAGGEHDDARPRQRRRSRPRRVDDRPRRWPRPPRRRRRPRPPPRDHDGAAGGPPPTLPPDRSLDAPRRPGRGVVVRRSVPCAVLVATPRRVTGAASRSRTSSSVVCAKSSYHRPTAKNGSGWRAQTISSATSAELLAGVGRADRHGDDDPGRLLPARRAATAARMRGAGGQPVVDER